jgi:uncharacterized membrane protein
MKRFADFVKTCIVGGLVGILPILLTAFVLAEAIDLLDGISTPLAEKLPIEELGGVTAAQIVALVLIVAACFLAGLLLRTRFGMWSTGFVEGAVLNRLPGYQLLKTVSQRLGGLQEGTLFSAALADLHGTEARAFAFIVEDHDDGRYTVLVPNAPTPSVGILYVLPRERVTRLSAPACANPTQLSAGGSEAFSEDASEDHGGLGVDTRRGRRLRT